LGLLEGPLGLALRTAREEQVFDFDRRPGLQDRFFDEELMDDSTPAEAIGMVYEDR